MVLIELAADAVDDDNAEVGVVVQEMGQRLHVGPRAEPNPVAKSDRRRIGAEEVAALAAEQGQAGL